MKISSPPTDVKGAPLPSIVSLKYPVMIGFPWAPRERSLRVWEPRPELWVAAQIRKRAATMAWTPGLTLDYARALSMLADPRPFSYLKMSRLAVRKMLRSRREWRQEASDAADARAGRMDGSRAS